MFFRCSGVGNKVRTQGSGKGRSTPAAAGVRRRGRQGLGRSSIGAIRDSLDLDLDLGRGGP